MEQLPEFQMLLGNITLMGGLNHNNTKHNMS